MGHIGQPSVQLLIIKNNYFEVYRENLTFILLAFDLKLTIYSFQEVLYMKYKCFKGINSWYLLFRVLCILEF